MKAVTRSARAYRIGSGVALAGVSLAVLAGCSPSTPAATPAPTVTVTVTPTATASPTPTPTSTASGSSAGAPVDISCTALVFDSTIAAYSPTFELEASFIPAPDNSFGEIGGPLDGTLCSWKDSESGSTLGVGVAKPSSADLAKYEAEVAAKGTSSTAVADTSSGRGYVIAGEAVELDLFTDSGYWIAVTSVIFDSPSAAKSIFANILQTLPTG